MQKIMQMLTKEIIQILAFFRVQTGSAFFVSLSISPGQIALGWHLVLDTIFVTSERPLHICYFFSKGNIRLVSFLFIKSPSKIKLVYSLFNLPQPDENGISVLFINYWKIVSVWNIKLQILLWNTLLETPWIYKIKPNTEHNYTLNPI
jgi:hypothetical protein